MTRRAFLRKYFPKFTAALALVGLIVYTLYHALGSSAGSLLTTPARRVTDTDTLSGEAVLFRAESVIALPAAGLVNDLVASALDNDLAAVLFDELCGKLDVFVKGKGRCIEHDGGISAEVAAVKLCIRVKLNVVEVDKHVYVIVKASLISKCVDIVEEEFESGLPILRCGVVGSLGAVRVVYGDSDAYRNSLAGLFSIFAAGS
jgi:hypothetical protein